MSGPPTYQALTIVGLCLSEAYDFAWPRNADPVHQHHKKPQGGLFACGIAADGVLVGVAIAARPNARCSDGTGKIGPRELWITRVAVTRDPPIPNACSMLYGAMRKAGAALGYSPVVTYTLASEPGTSMRAAGFRSVGERGGGRVERSGTRKGHAGPARAHAGRGARQRRLSDRAEDPLGVAVNTYTPPEGCPPVWVEQEITAGYPGTIWHRWFAIPGDPTGVWGWDRWCSPHGQSFGRPDGQEARPTAGKVCRRCRSKAPAWYTATDARRNATAVFTETVIPGGGA